MEQQLLKLVIHSRDDFDLIRQHITTKAYSREFGIVFDYISDYYERDQNADHVNVNLLVELMSSTMTNEKHVERFKEFIEEAQEADVSAANVKQVILQAKQREVGNELAIAIANGKEHEELLQRYSDLLEYTDLDDLLEKGVEVYDASSLDDLINHETDPASKLQIYPLALNDRVDGGVQGSDHITVIARPEAGKTGLILTMANGFARQGAVGIIFNNEERITRLRLRALSCATGMTAHEIRANPQAAKDIAEQMGYHNIIFVSMSPGTPRQIEAFVERYKAKWFIVDQLRHLAIKSDTRTNQLEAAANAIRNIAKKYDAVAITVTQAGDSAEGKAVLDMGDVDSSNTGIPGAYDVLLGIGATEQHKEQGVRILSLSKNKLGGVHDAFPVRFNPAISKYVSSKELGY